MHNPGFGRPGGTEGARLTNDSRHRRDKPQRRCALGGVIGLPLALLLGGCAYKVVVPPSEGHINRESVAPDADRDQILPPLTTSTYVPPPTPRAKVPTYSVVVHEVPVKELLLALARDTKQNIDIHPGLRGLVSLNAIDETLPAILERMTRQVNMRYRVEGTTIVVGPDTPYFKTYRVDYVNMTRDTTSTIAVSGQITGGGGGGATAPSGGTSSTSVNTTSKNNFWELLQQNIQSILTSTRTLAQNADEKQAQAESARAAREERLAQAEAVARAGPNASNLFDKVFGASPTGAVADIKQDLVVNQVAGTVSLMATERQHQLVQQYLDAVAASSRRQVLIEATIAEVTLSKTYQAGLDWSRLSFHGAGFTFTQGLLGTIGPGAGAAPTGLTVGYSNNTSNSGNLSATVKLLEQFGNTRVLSSPKLMAMNNQTALLKVVDNIVYFTIQSSVSQAVQGSTLSSVTTTPNTVAVGVVLSMTPQINDSNVITLNVRPTITRINGSVQDPNPLLTRDNNGNPLANPIKSQIPQVQVREMESVLQLVSGQTAILGGLMQDNIQRNTDQIPGLGSIPRVGEAFQFRNDNVVKTELVIFIRPVVVRNPSLDSEELKHLRRCLPEVDKTGLNP
jgi:MSHA biogenesis protein MshL